MNSLNSIIRFGITFIIIGIILYILGFLIAVVIVSFLLIVKGILAYIKAHKRFTDWELDNIHHTKVTWVDGRNVRERVRSYKRYDRRLDTWEVRYETTPMGEKPTANSTLEDLFDYHGKYLHRT